VPYKGLASNIIEDILGGVRSACAYVGASSLKDLPKCAEFIKVNRVHFDRSV
jgi:GMP reductase